MQNIDSIHTACKNCIFATYEDNTQKDCMLDELYLFRKHNIEILEAYDEEKEFYIINKNKCLKYRTKDWKYTNEGLIEQEKMVWDEISLRYHAIIFADDNLENIKTTVQSLLDQELRPVYITIVRQFDNDLLPSQIHEVVKECPIRWRIENIIKDCATEEIIDMIVPFVKVPIYTVFKAGCNVPRMMFSYLNERVHKLQLNLILLTPDKYGNGMVVSTKIHETYQGNLNDTLENKLIKDGCTFIYPVTDIIHRFSL